MGGSNHKECKGDFYELNKATQEVTQDELFFKLSDSDKEFWFVCASNQSYVTRKGEVIALVDGYDGKGQLISYRYGAASIRRIYTYQAE